MDIFYSDSYYADIGEHLFPMDKYRLAREVLLIKGEFGPEHFEEAYPIDDKDLVRFHTAEYVEKIKNGKLSPEEVEILEMPFFPEMVKSFYYHAGGTLQSARKALKDGISCNLGGGFHHAYPDHGEGLCLINDVGVAAKTLLDEGAVERVLILDLDVHQGNGNAFFFKDDPRVMTFSIHCESIYPDPKEHAGINIGLPDGIMEDAYMDTLRSYFFTIFDEFLPNLVIYVAGGDVYEGDLIGRMKLSIAGIKHRDESVFWEAASRSISIVSVAGGGYARRIDDLVTIHANTLRAADHTAAEFRRRQYFGDKMK